MNNKSLWALAALIVALPLISLGAAPGPADSGGDAKPAVEAEADAKVGSDICRACHADKAQTYAISTHGIKEHPYTPASKDGCETCHGPGKRHVESGGGKGVGIVPLSLEAPTPAATKNAVCMSCHVRGKVALWQGSAHQRRGLTCSTCHNVHSGLAKNLSAPSQGELCARCHKDIQAQLQRPSHHPIREGKVRCSDCHNPHGSIARRLISASSLNEKCYECHADKRGPQLYEHAPVTEKCTTCHTPHGSSHQRLLTQKVPFLCQRCHSNARHPGTLYALGSAGTVYTNNPPSQRGIYRACLNCHSQVHGSNHPGGKGLVR